MDRRWLVVMVVSAVLLAHVGVGRIEAKAAEPVSDLPTVDEPVASIPAGSATDNLAKERNEERLAHEGLSVKERKIREGTEKFEFQAEINRLMDIIINSLYSNKDIFLRELISNASDALDKIRFLSLTDPKVLGEGDAAKLEIKISVDKDNKVISIRDRGIGMTKEDLINNLGTIAKSGTSSFLEKMQKEGDMNLIGQFGVGFYSSYLVSDFVQVISKHNDDKQYIWESQADGSFVVVEDTENEPLGRGTQINIFLKDEAQEYLDEAKLKELVKRYSEFINFPIYLYTSKEVDVEVPADEDEDEDEGEGEGESDVDVDEEEGEGEDKPKTKTIKETRYEWELLNDNKAIWLRNPKEVEEEEYVKFYKAISKDYDEPLTYTHFNAEGDVEFKAVLFVPARAPHDLYDNYYSTNANLKMYVRRVFISDEFEELLPKYLNFLKGLVDSDSLPLNVSREMLQQHSSLKTIKKKLVRKALDMIRKLADDDEADDEEGEEGEEGEGSDNKDKDTKGEKKYEKFWAQYGRSIKLGIIEDASNRTRLAKLLRFYTSASPDKLTSLDEYIERMKEGQKHIYYIAGENLEQVKGSPFVERLLKKGFEVIYFTDSIDEYTMQNLTEYDDHRFQNVSKEDLKLGEENAKEKERKKAIRDAFKPLTKWWKEQLGSDLEAVKLSDRLSESPCVVVTSKYGWSANMERIMRAQALTDESRNMYMRGKKTLEINPRHPLIKELKAKVEADPEDKTAVTIAHLMYESALLESGFVLEDTKTFGSRLLGLMKGALGVDPDAKVDEEEEIPDDEEPTAEDAADGSEPAPPPAEDIVKDEL
eukprot:jgi/Mesvir1/24542/Mv21880-RA.1